MAKISSQSGFICKTLFVLFLADAAAAESSSENRTVRPVLATTLSR